MKKILSIFGTRPEAIKFSILLKKLEINSNLKSIVCVTGQHREMLDQILNTFDISPQYDLNLMVENQTPTSFISKALPLLDEILKKELPDIVLVQGDTSSTLIGSLAAYHNMIPVGHIEAGLRTDDKYQPFPEETYRRIVSQIADYHFTPTIAATKNLFKSNIISHVYHTGNTSIDALNWVLLNKNNNNTYKNNYILITIHRRENFEKVFDICKVIKNLSILYPHFNFIFPVHPNPKIKNVVFESLSNQKNIILTSPMNYVDFIFTMSGSYLILTDSGGIQEEAPSLNVPVLVMRNLTERFEGVECGVSKLIGVETKSIIDNVSNLIENKKCYDEMRNIKNPYGDGKSSDHIIKIIEDILNEKN